MGLTVTVITAVIPPRAAFLQRSITSVAEQIRRPDAHIVQVDHHRAGGPATLDAAIAAGSTDLVAILDDDDELLPRHLEVCVGAMEATGADLVYPWFRYSSTGDGGHLERWRGVPWVQGRPHQVPITWVARRDAVLDAGGFSGGFDPRSYDVDEQGNRIGYDFHLIRKLDAAGADIRHVDEVTWIYHVHPFQTLGMPNRW